MKTGVFLMSKFLKSILFLLVVFFTVNTALYADDSRDVIIALDTSLSMIGRGGDNIMDQVKSSLEKYVDKLNEDDSLTFMTFDSQVVLYETVQIKEEAEQKDTIKKFIRPIQARGKWTYTKAMFEAVFQKAAELQEKDPDRQQVIIILTDAMDDPPPAKKDEQLDIKEIADNIEGGENFDSSEWFVYMLSFAKLQQSDKVEKLKDDLKENISEYSDVVKADENVSESVENIDQEVEKMEEQKKKDNPSIFLNPFLIAGLITIILLALLFYFKKMSKVKIRGVLKYRNLDKIKSEEEEVSLTKYDLKRIEVGSTPSFEVYIMEYADSKPLVLEAVSFKGNVKVQINEEAGARADFRDEKKESFLNDGDVFRVSNYEFTYLEEE